MLRGAGASVLAWRRGVSRWKGGRDAIQRKGEEDGYGDGDDDVDHPKYPDERQTPLPPVGHAGEENHLDDGREAHRDCTEEEGVDGVVDHDGPDFGVEGVAEDGDDEGEGEEDDVEDEEDNREPVQPVGPVGD